jgi:hypothetical protein
MIGAIEIGPDDSTFDVATSVARRFAQRVRRPDSRDPKLKIERVGGSRGAGRGDEPTRRRATPRKPRDSAKR